MKAVKIVLMSLAGLALLSVALVGAGGAWLSSNVDTVAEAAVNASGIKDEISKQRRERCALAKAEFDRMWDDAVDRNRLEERQGAIESAEAGMKAICSAK